MTQTCILTLSCADRPGLVATVAAFLASHRGNILEAQQFDDRESGLFFMRVVAELAEPWNDIGKLSAAFSTVAADHEMDWSLRDAAERRRVLLLVSKFDHCLGDLLYRHRIGELPMEVVGIVSNHPMAALNTTMIGDIPYHQLPVTKETKAQQEAQIKAVVDETGAELIVLAR